MGLIKKVRLSAPDVVVGEPILVTVDVTDPSALVTVNNVPARERYLQFPEPGSPTIVVGASVGAQAEQKGKKVRVKALPGGELPYPLLQAAMDRYQPRTVVFSLAEVLADVVSYAWDFGDGTTGASEDPWISHDYTASLERDSLTTAFDVTVTANYASGVTRMGRRTIAVFCLYAYNKTRHHVLTPRVEVLEPTSLPLVGVLCGFVIHNLEDEDLVFDGETHEWLSTEDDAPIQRSSHLVAVDVSRATEEVLAGIPTTTSTDQVGERAGRASPLVFAARALQAPFLQAPIYLVADDPEIRVPARSSLTIIRFFENSKFQRPIFGVAVHLQGGGASSETPAATSAYFEVRLPIEWGGEVGNQKLVNVLTGVSRALGDPPKVTHDVLTQVAYQTPPSPEPEVEADAETELVIRSGMAGRAAEPAAASPRLLSTSRLAAAAPGLITPEFIPLDEPAVVKGAECDPDDLPDVLPEGAVCQVTGETAWRFVPGRILNAKKGDVILSHDGQHMIGQLLQHLTPPQYYSHSGIMTKNHIQLRHSTGSEEWLRDHPKGMGGKPTDGFEPAALKYLWPGTITQTIDHAGYFEWIPSPDHGPYLIHGFSFDPDISNASTVVYPLVVKPPPFHDTPSVRAALHSIANEALNINGHYRFYCYTDPAIALDPGYVAGADAGWAQGTVPTVCSSFIWLSAQRAGVKLEGAAEYVTAAELEPADVVAGAAVDGNTRDGLYYYNEAERQAAGRWLYQNIYDTAYGAAGWLGTLFTDAPDDIANQICNTFASDWSDTDAKDSDAWKEPGSGNAVSPDNIKWWDSPGPGNEEQFAGVYGHYEELFYRPGTYAQVPIYRWNIVPTRGNLTGTVVANGDVDGATVTLQGTGQDTTVGPDGRFEFDNIPAGDYMLSAGLNIDGYWNSKDQKASVAAGKTTDVTIALDPPPETNRMVTISVDMVTDWKSIWAHSPRPYDGTKTARVHPWHSHEHLEFEGGDSPHGKIMFDIDLNPDFSITVSWTAQEIDDEVEGEVKGGFDVAAGYWRSWSGLTVANDDPIDADWTSMSFTVNNDTAPA
jgi:hypothetical protein